MVGNRGRSPRGREVPFTRASAVPIAAVVGLGAFVLTYLALRLVLVNARGPLGRREVSGVLLGTAAALAVSVALYLLVRALARRSAVALFTVLGVLAVAAVVLFPTRFGWYAWHGPQALHTGCWGWSFPHQPYQTTDAGTGVYCVGLEHALPRSSP